VFAGYKKQHGLPRARWPPVVVAVVVDRPKFDEYCILLFIDYSVLVVCTVLQVDGQQYCAVLIIAQYY
jgi:hypothetical protein